MTRFLFPAFDPFVVWGGEPEAGFPLSVPDSRWQCGLCASVFSATSRGTAHRAGDAPTLPVRNPALGVT